MDAALFLDQFGHLAASPNGVSKLRSLILDLAVRGQLVPQHPDDEPASELLKRIEAKKQRLIKAGELKPSKPLPPVRKDEIPYEVPQGWAWVRINEIGHDWGQKKPDQIFTYIDVGAIDQHYGTVKNPTVLSPADAPSRAKKIVRRGTVIYATVRPYLLNIAVINDEYEPEPIASTAFAIIHPYDGITARYTYYYLRSSAFVKHVEAEMKGMAYPAINDGKFFASPFPVPPLDEQARIVAKVDELMALCDQLETEQVDHAQLRDQAAKSTLYHITSTASRTEAYGHWRYAEQHFPHLFERSASVADLRATILQLAVQGRLVPQNPDDEPASELLKRIEAEKQRLIKAGELKPSKPLPPVREDEIPYEVPQGWAWTRLDKVCWLITDGAHHTPTYVSDGVPFLSVKDVSSGFIDFRNTRYIPQEEHDQLKKRCNPEYHDILLTKVGTTGIAVLIETDAEFSIFVSLALLKFFQQFLFPKFLTMLINSPLVKQQSEENTQGVGNKNLVLRLIKNFIIPIPLLEEQERIIAKVDELMALCDQLEAVAAERQALAGALFDSIVNALFEGAK